MSSPESEKKRLQELNRTAAVATINNEASRHQHGNEKKKIFDLNPLLNLLAGFLRLSNYASASAVAISLGLYVTTTNDSHKELLSSSSSNEEEEIVHHVTFWIRFVCLISVALLVMVDSVATFTVCKKEKELSYTNEPGDDSSSSLFSSFLSPGSRWVWRATAALVLATATTTTAMTSKSTKIDLDLFMWTPMLALAGLPSSLIGVVINRLTKEHQVPWLKDAPEKKRQNRNYYTKKNRFVPPESVLKSRFLVAMVSKFVFLLAFLSSMVTHCLALGLKPKSEGLESWKFMASFVSCQILNLGTIPFVIVVRKEKVLSSITGWQLGERVSSLCKMVAMFTLSVAVSDLLETMASSTIKFSLAWYWIGLMSSLVLCCIVEMLLHADRCYAWVCSFFVQNRTVSNNSNNDGRSILLGCLDTFGTLTALSGMVLSLCSIFVDQYDLVFEPKDLATDVISTLDSFELRARNVTTSLNNLVNSLDPDFTCKDLYIAGGTATAMTVLAGLLPLGGTIASIGSRAISYGSSIARVLTNLAAKLRRSKDSVAKLVRSANSLREFTLASFQGLLLASNLTTMVKLLPFLPPIVLGVYVLFGAFWPRPIRIHSSNQWRKTVHRLLYTRILSLLALSLALVINNTFLEEIVQLLDGVPLVSIGVEKKFGWQISSVAYGFSIVSTFVHAMAALVLTSTKTSSEEEDRSNNKCQVFVIGKENNDNNDDEDNTSVSPRQTVVVSPSSPWIWALPVLLCLSSCTLAYVATSRPKFEFHLEPRGAFVQALDSVQSKFSAHASMSRTVWNDLENEGCLNDIFRKLKLQREVRLVLRPAYSFFNETEKLTRPVNRTLTRLRRQMSITDLSYNNNTASLEDNVWQGKRLQKITLLLLFPRLICLVVLVFFGLLPSCCSCVRRLFFVLQPKMVVDLYGKTSFLSFVYVVGTQLAIFNLSSTVSVPFFDVSVRLGQGFVCDLVADCVMVSVYVGMRNEMFFHYVKCQKKPFSSNRVIHVN